MRWERHPDWSRRTPKIFTPEVLALLKVETDPENWLILREYETVNHKVIPVHPPWVECRFSYKGGRAVLKARARPVST